MEYNLIVYENCWIINKVYEVSDRLHSQLVDPTLFEERSIRRVGEYLAQSESNRNNRRYITRLINEVASAVVDRNKNEHAFIFSGLASEDEEGEAVVFDPVDVLANVESEVITKETADLLAQDDRRKELILGSWLIGNDNNAHISRLLAQSLGGNVESHRKYIQRFRSDCREVLAAV